MNTILEVKKLSMDFGGIRALDNLDMVVREGEIVALIGPNGAGKTTFFNCVTGIYEPTGGDILLKTPEQKKEIRLNKLKPNQVTGHGIARTFQNIRLFRNMTALENVMIGCHSRTRAGIIGAIFKFSYERAEEKEIVRKSRAIIEHLGLGRYRNEFAKNLPYGLQRRLEIARALATEPFLILLDEPAAGMNPQETKELDDLIKDIRAGYRLSVLLIEHDMKLVMSISDRIIVLDYGEKIAEGSPGEIKNNAAVIEAYLGEEVYA